MDAHRPGRRDTEASPPCAKPGLWHQLSEQDVEVGSQRKRDGHSQQVGVDPGVGHAGGPGSKRVATAGSPIQPRARLQRVTPSCLAGRKSSMFSCRRRTALARAAPGQFKRSMRVCARSPGQPPRHEEAVRQDEEGDGNRPKEHQFNHCAQEPGSRPQMRGRTRSSLRHDTGEGGRRKPPDRVDSGLWIPFLAPS